MRLPGPGFPKEYTVKHPGRGSPEGFTVKLLDPESPERIHSEAQMSAVPRRNKPEDTAGGPRCRNTMLVQFPIFLPPNLLLEYI